MILERGRPQFNRSHGYDQQVKPIREDIKRTIPEYTVPVFMYVRVSMRETV